MSNQDRPDQAADVIEFVDTELNCIDCARTFTWTAGEQQFFCDHELKNPPKRCKPCKRAKTVRIAAIEDSRKTGDRPKIEISVKCEKCNIQTTVPFYPSQGRPVYCRECFKAGQVVSANAAGT